MRIAIPTKDGVSQFNDISASGYTTGQLCSRKNITLVVNGIIKNLKFLGAMRTDQETQDAQATQDIQTSQLSILIDLYEQYGFEYMIQLLEGEFSIILLDHNLNKSDSRIYIAQDRLGLCPLYVFMEETTSDRKIMGFANTAQQLHMESVLYETKYTVYPFEPGTYSIYEYTFKVLSYWKPVVRNARFAAAWPKNRCCIANGDSISTRRVELLKAVETIREALKESIQVDLAVCWEGEAKAEPLQTLSQLPPPSHPLPEPHNDNQSTYFCPIPNKGGPPIGCLLSGGIDSSIVTALLRDHLKLRDYNPNQHIYTFAMGFAGSSDLKNAKRVADYLETRHDEFVLLEDDYMAVIPKVIEILETADIATVRYGVALYLLLQRIHDTTPIRDIFTGDGADEMMGGFLNFYYMKDMIEHDYECNRLLQQYHRRGALYRKLFHHFGMRWYKPFLNDVFLSKYMSIPIELRFQTELGFLPPPSWFTGDKNLLRVTFSGEYYKDCWFRNLLPNWILWRTEEPGYDGIGSYLRPLSWIIRDALDGDTNIVESKESAESAEPAEPIAEMEYYKSIYTKLFSCMHINDDLPPYKYAKTLYEPTMRSLDVFLDLHLEYQDRSL